MARLSLWTPCGPAIHGGSAATGGRADRRDDEIVTTGPRFLGGRPGRPGHRGTGAVGRRLAPLRVRRQITVKAPPEIEIHLIRDAARVLRSGARSDDVKGRRHSARRRSGSGRAGSAEHAAKLLAQCESGSTRPDRPPDADISRLPWFPPHTTYCSPSCTKLNHSHRRFRRRHGKRHLALAVPEIYSLMRPPVWRRSCEVPRSRPRIRNVSGSHLAVGRPSSANVVAAPLVDPLAMHR